jgi:predicted dehydrogenase
VSGSAGEDMIEKQTAEQGLMPIVVDEEGEYGYTAEDRHMVDRFLAEKTPAETFEDGLEVTKLIMACYLAAERGERLTWPVTGLGEFLPSVSAGTYRARDLFKGKA